MPDISSAIGDDAKMVCCGKGCSIRTHYSLRGSASFCNNGYVLATKFGGDTTILEIPKT